jgi:hypothetical protein
MVRPLGSKIPISKFMRKKQETTADVLNLNPLNVLFRRALVGKKLLE